MTPGPARLQLVAPIGVDAMGTYWHAHDLARGVPVQVHELQGAYAEWRPATHPGYELVVEGDRVFVILPTAPAPASAAPVYGAPASAAPVYGAPIYAAPAAPARKSGARWAIIGVVG